MQPHVFFKEKNIAMVKRFPRHLRLGKGNGDNFCICTNPLYKSQTMIKYKCGHIIHESCFEQLISSGPHIHDLTKDVKCPFKCCVLLPGRVRFQNHWMTKTRPWIRQRKAAVKAVPHELTECAQDHCAQVSDPASCHKITHVTDSHQYRGTSITNQSEMTSTLEASEDFAGTLNLGQCSSKFCGQRRYFGITSSI